MATSQQSIEQERIAESRPLIREDARGGFSFGSVIAGMLVAFGAFVVLAAIVGGILAATGISDGGVSADEAVNASIGAGIGMVIVQFLSYLWGGYVAGRMARGSGVLNGILVPIVALVLVAILGAIVAGVTSSATSLNPADVQRLPLPLGSLSDIGTGIGIALLVAMLAGGALGGAWGERWHAKLEEKERVA
jgi:hypothetical protein